MSIRLSGSTGAYGAALDRADGDIGERDCQKAQPERNFKAAIADRRSGPSKRSER